MSTVEMPTIPAEYADSVLATFVQYYDQSLSDPHREETKTRGWDAASIKESLITVGVDTYKASPDVSQFKRPDPKDVDSYVHFILEEGHTKLSHRDRLDMFLSTAMERPWVTRKADGTPRLTCDMCKIFSQTVDTARVKRGSFRVHWRDCDENKTCTFMHPNVTGRYSTEHQTCLVRFHTGGGWRSYPRDKFELLKSTLKDEKEGQEEIDPGLYRFFFNELWCTQQAHACHLELKGEVTQRGRDLRYFNILNSGGLPEQMWRVTDNDVRKGIEQVETGQIRSLWESKPDAWKSVDEYLRVAAMAVTKIEEEETRQRARPYSEYCDSVRTDEEDAGELTRRDPKVVALAEALAARARSAQTSASAGGAEEGVA